jgi:prolyl oligopeptidase
MGYPATRRDDVTDDYHGDLVADPYRWLEDTADPQTQAWIAAQNELTESVLAAVPSRPQITAQLTSAWNYPRPGVPFERGGRWFQTRNSGLQDQSVLYVMAAPDDSGAPLLDANELSADGTVSLVKISVSPDGSRLAYATASSGSDWLTWRVRDVAAAADTGDELTWSKLEAAEWQADGSGFFYGAKTPPRPGTELLESDGVTRIFFHRLGAAQGDDELVFAPEDAGLSPWIAVSPDGRYLIVTLNRGLGSQTQVRVLDLDDRGAGLRVLVPEAAAAATVVAVDDSTFYVLTDDGAGTGRIVAIDLARPDRDSWREIIAAGRDVLCEAHHFGGALVCHYLRDACSALAVFGLDGTPTGDIPVPDLATLGGSQVYHDAIEGTPDSERFFFEVVSCTQSGSLWSHDLATGRTELVRGPAVELDPDRFVTERVYVTLADGGAMPMFLTRRRDLRRNGAAPVLLYGYGGVGIPITPSFSVPWAVWVERGGLLAVASLPGGGEYGRAWYESGRLASKQNVFDAFCACARWLVSSGWSRARRIAINGGSNGGLLVGACLTQHPELFGAAIADVGVFDMLRFHHFTVGRWWLTEYGDPGDPAEYRWLRRYSPLHNVRAASYPPTLLTTGDHDDRVVPGHSFKFAATLQAAQQADRPVLLRVATAGGHGDGKPTSQAIAEAADRLAFLDYALPGPGGRA